MGTLSTLSARMPQVPEWLEYLNALSTRMPEWLISFYRVPIECLNGTNFGSLFVRIDNSVRNAALSKRFLAKIVR